MVFGQVFGKVVGLFLYQFLGIDYRGVCVEDDFYYCIVMVGLVFVGFGIGWGVYIE